MIIKQQQLILKRIEELDKANLSIHDVEGFLFPLLIKTMPKEVQKAYDKMISNKIPF